MSEPIAAKILVVFFSRTGTTRQVAEALARAAGADVEELRESRSRHGIWGYLRSGFEGTYRRPSLDLRPVQRNPRDYDIVLIGGPTWSGSLPSPVRAYLEQERAFSSAGYRAVRHLRRRSDRCSAWSDVGIADQAALATLTLPEAEVKRGSAAEIAEFLEKVLVAWEKQRRK